MRRGRIVAGGREGQRLPGVPEEVACKGVLGVAERDAPSQRLTVGAAAVGGRTGPLGETAPGIETLRESPRVQTPGVSKTVSAIRSDPARTQA